MNFLHLLSEGEEGSEVIEVIHNDNDDGSDDDDDVSDDDDDLSDDDDDLDDGEVDGGVGLEYLNKEELSVSWNLTVQRQCSPVYNSYRY